MMYLTHVVLNDDKFSVQIKDLNWVDSQHHPVDQMATMVAPHGALTEIQNVTTSSLHARIPMHYIRIVSN